MAKDYRIKLENYIKIHQTSNGIEYTWLEGCGVPIDGGVIEEFDLTDDQALEKVLENIDLRRNIEIKKMNEEVEVINHMVFRDKESKIPLTRAELAEIYWNGDKEKIEKYGYPSHRLALYTAECKCQGQGQFVLVETKEEDKKKGIRQNIRCKICGNYSHL